MTIDERLTLIAQSLDTLTKLHIDLDHKTEARFAQVADSLEKLGARLDQTGARLERLEEQTEARFIKTLDIIDRLAAAVAEHERRIDKLDRP